MNDTKDQVTTHVTELETYIADSQLLKGMMKAAPKNDARYYMNGVHMFGNTIEASNGHYVFQATLESDFEGDVIFRLTGDIPSSARETVLDFEKKLATHLNSKGQRLDVSAIEMVDGSFPDTARFFGRNISDNPLSEITVNTKYLSLATKLFGPAAEGATLRQFESEGSPAYIVNYDQSYHKLRAIIMGIRI